MNRLLLSLCLLGAGLATANTLLLQRSACSAVDNKIAALSSVKTIAPPKAPGSTPQRLEARKATDKALAVASQDITGSLREDETTVPSPLDKLSRQRPEIRSRNGSKSRLPPRCILNHPSRHPSFGIITSVRSCESSNGKQIGPRSSTPLPRNMDGFTGSILFPKTGPPNSKPTYGNHRRHPRSKVSAVGAGMGRSDQGSDCVRGIPEMVSGYRGGGNSAAPPMRLTARQCFQIAAVYENAAADTMNVPRQQRAAFTRKARWFHMLARIKAAKEAAVVFKKNPLLNDDTDLIFKPRRGQCGHQTQNISPSRKG